MVLFLKKRWFLFLLLVVFISFQVPHLFYPFYWDESWSYAPGVKLMYEHGPSLMPDAIDAGYSRGHPLFFYASAATWMHIFGTSHVAQHAFGLFISVLLIFSIYETSFRIFNQKVAVLSSLFISVQVMFFVQASFLLPEIMVALLALTTLYFYVKRQYLLTFIACSALVFTKESGMILGLILGVHSIIGFFSKQVAMGDKVKRFLSIFLVGLAIGGFFMFQRVLKGWFFFPDHVGLMTLDWSIFYNKIRQFLSIVFFDDYRSHLFIFLLTLSLGVAVFKKKIKYAAPLFPGAMIYLIVQNSFPAIPEFLLFIFLIKSFGISAYLFIKSDSEPSETRNEFIYLSFAFIVLYLCFTAVNFMTGRYVLSVLIIVGVLTAYFFDCLTNILYKPIFYPIFTAIAFFGLYGIINDTGLGDLDRGAFDAMTVQEDVIRYLEKNDLYDHIIVAGSYQNREQLSNPNAGFLHSDRKFQNLRVEIDSDTEYVLFDNITPDIHHDEIAQDSNYRLVYRATSNTAWMEVYKRIGH